MCQLSSEEVHNSIEHNISNHLNESKLLDEWHFIINGELPRSRRMTQRKLAHLFRVFGRKGVFNVEHLGRSYAFYSIS